MWGMLASKKLRLLPRSVSGSSLRRVCRPRAGPAQDTRRRAKYILKKAVEDLLQRNIIYRKKMGFPTPLRPWLLDQRAQPLFSMLLDPEGLLASYVDKAAMGALIERHQNGVEDATDRIWRLLNLQIWGDLFLTGRSNRRWEGLLSGASIAS